MLVSCGLLAEITVNGKYGPGDLVPAPGEVTVAVRVLGPGWATADKVELYANGRKIREAAIPDGTEGRREVGGEWTLPRFKHDVHLVAVATGPGVTELYWPIAKPYQPTSPRRQRRVIGATGAVLARRRRRRQADQRSRLRRAAGRDAGGDVAESRRRTGRLRRGGGGAGRGLVANQRRVVTRRGCANGGEKGWDACKRTFEDYAESLQQRGGARQDAETMTSAVVACAAACFTCPCLCSRRLRSFPFSVFVRWAMAASRHLLP